MKLVYGISRWNNSSRARTRHIDNGEGLPLCGAKAFSFEPEEGEPTCARCIKLNAKRVLDRMSESLELDTPIRVHR